MLSEIWNPGVYHGGSPDRQFFEGWYFKLISADKKQRLAIIPGVFLHPDPALRHAFIQCLNGVTHQVVYHRFPIDDFMGSNSNFEVRIDKNLFSAQQIELDLERDSQSLKGTVNFSELNPWPITPLSPGVMGPYRFAPLMQTYHGILSLDHSLDGTLVVDGRQTEFSGGRGYIEKDWGRTFPRAYIWMQSNHFSDLGISVTASVATIPWLGGWFRGFLVGFYLKGRLFRFTTYLGSEITRLAVSDQLVVWEITGTKRSDPAAEYPGYGLRIQARRKEGGLLSSPELDGMTPRILESLTADIEVTLTKLDRGGNPAGTLYHGTGACGGLEVAGSIHEIVDQDQEGGDV